MSIYKACDIRGIYGEDLTEQQAFAIGKAVGYKISGQKIIVGGDVRTSTPVLKETIIKALFTSGCEVLDIGIVPTPVFHFFLRHLSLNNGIMVTASHNPAQFNGFKIVLDGLPVIPEDLEEIRDLAESKNWVEKQGEIQNISSLPLYIRWIKSLSPTGEITVVIDSGNGSYSEIAPLVFQDLGYKVIELFCQIDGRFPNRNPNPAVADNLSSLSQKVLSNRANLGIAFDGDGDRVVFVDDKGKAVPSDKSIILLAKYVLKDKPGNKVVYDIKCSQIVPENIKFLNCTPIMEKSGHSFIKRRMISENALFGGEISGHFFYQDLQGGDDGLYSALLMAHILSQSNQSLFHLASQIPTYYITPDIRIPYEKDDKEKILHKIKEGLSRYEINTLDGVRVQFPQGWGLVRISVTEPLLTFRFESKTKGELEEIMNLFLSPVPSIKNLVHQYYSSLYKGGNYEYSE